MPKLSGIELKKAREKAWKADTSNLPEKQATWRKWRKQLVEAGKLYSEDEKRSYRAGLIAGYMKAKKYL